MKARDLITEANYAPKILADPRLTKMLAIAMRHDDSIPRSRIAKLGPRATDKELVLLWGEMMDETLSRTKYGNISSDGKFDAWLTRIYLNHAADYEMISGTGGDALGAWKTLSTHGSLDKKEQDLNKFNNLPQVQKLVALPKYRTELKRLEDLAELKRQQKNDKKIVLIDDERFFVFVPLTYGSCYVFNNSMGINAVYCTGSSGGQSWFDKYTKKGPIVCILDKKNMKNKNGKWQMHAADDQLNNAMQDNRTELPKNDKLFSELFPGLMRKITKAMMQNSEELKEASKELNLQPNGWNIPADVASIKRKIPLSYTSRAEDDDDDDIDDDAMVWKIKVGGNIEPVYFKTENRDEAIADAIDKSGKTNPQIHVKVEAGTSTSGKDDLGKGWMHTPGQDLFVVIDYIRSRVITQGIRPEGWLWKDRDLVWKVMSEAGEIDDDGEIGDDSNAYPVGYVRGGKGLDATLQITRNLGLPQGKQYSQPGTLGEDRVWKNWDGIPDDEPIQVAVEPAGQTAQGGQTAQAGENRSWEIVRLPGQVRMSPREFLAAPSYRAAWEQLTQQPRFRGLGLDTLENHFDLIHNDDAVRQQPAEPRRREFQVIDRRGRNNVRLDIFFTSQHRVGSREFNSEMANAVRRGFVGLSSANDDYIVDRFYAVPAEEDNAVQQPAAQADEDREWRVISGARATDDIVRAPNENAAMQQVVRLIQSRNPNNSAGIINAHYRVEPVEDDDDMPDLGDWEPEEDVGPPYVTWRVRWPNGDIDRTTRARSAEEAIMTVAQSSHNVDELHRFPHEWQADPVDQVGEPEAPAQQEGRDWEVVDRTTGRRIGIHYNAPTRDEAFDRFINYMVQEHGHNDLDVAARYNIVPLGQQ